MEEMDGNHPLYPPKADHPTVAPGRPAKHAPGAKAAAQPGTPHASRLDLA